VLCTDEEAAGRLDGFADVLKDGDGFCIWPIMPRLPCKHQRYNDSECTYKI
jgi:hypothetical protein